MTDDNRGLRDTGEEALGKLAQNLLENPLVTGAISRAFEAREKAVQAQEVAFSALNIPSAADIERLTRRLRSVAQRLEAIEDSLDRLDRRLESTPDSELAAKLDALTEEVRKLSGSGATAKKSAPKQR